MNWPLFLMLGVTFGISASMTELVRRYALRQGVLDLPNSRSSHTRPTPRGGGIAIVCAFSIFVILTEVGLPTASKWALLLGGLMIALLGFCDDHGHISARWRFLAQGLIVTLCLIAMGGFPAFDAPWGRVENQVIIQIFGFLFLVWMINLYNFMDGIDGLAAGEATVVGTCYAALLYFYGPASVATLALGLAIASAGFLIWNFPPARIFMGDAGSGFLGIALGLIAVLAAQWDDRFLYSFVILFGVFIVDATVTLIRRLLGGQRVYEAHRSHAYQQLTRRARAHKPVTLGVGVINLLWLLPWGWAAMSGVLPGWVCMLCALAPLVIAALAVGAGSREVQK